ncbi:MAG: thioredoxin domain-containing protein [Haloarculaceae archaeon]
MNTRRRFLAAAGLAGASAVAGCSSLGGGSDDTPVGTPASGAVSGAPVPDDPASHDYATAGTGSRPVVTYYGNWKCPFCADFSTGESDGPVLPLETIVADYVEPGELSLRYRGLAYGSDGEPFLGPDAPRATRAGLAVWTVDPERYWSYHEHVMANQPPEDETWATTDRLVSFARDAGVSPVEGVRSAVENGRFEDRVTATTGAAADAGVRGTPTLVVDGDTYSPFEPGATREALDGLTP